MSNDIDADMRQFAKLDREGMIAAYHWHRLSCQQREETARAAHERETNRLRDIGDAARAWWNHSVAEKKRGRKTVRMEGWV